MKRWLNILVFFAMAMVAYPQEETRIVDSLLNVLPTQEGREKVETMIELTWEFYDVSYDECLDWGEKAIKEAQGNGFADLEAKATFALAMQYGYHSDLDLAQDYLKQAFALHQSVGDEARAFEDLWNQAYFEQLWGNLDSSFLVYEEALSFAERRNDTLAMANIYANMAVIRYQTHDFEQSEMYFKKCRSLYVLLNDSFEITRANANMANLYMEWGKYSESQRLYQEAIAEFEKLQRYDFLLMVYKNYGSLFEKQFVNYDSASFYFDKAMACIDQMERPMGSLKVVVNTKADLLVEMGNLAIIRSEEAEARRCFEEALSLAEGNSYHFGMMQAALSLGQLYANQGKASLSMHYLDIYREESQKSGITMMEPTARKPFVLVYARLGRFDEMTEELEALDEERRALQRESYDLRDQLSLLQDEAVELLSQYDSQNHQIESLQSQRNQYRLAFFGLLALVLATLVFATAFKIVRKNQAKNTKH